MVSGAWVLSVPALVLIADGPSRPAAQPRQCPSPRVSQWSSIRDTLWPQITHREGDHAWAHLDTLLLPRGAETWCNPLANDGDAQQAGRDIYRDQCSACHGDGGTGDGPGGATADPAPYDFTRPEFAGMAVPPGPGLLYAMLARGIAGSTMVAFPELSGYERLAVIAYIQRFPGPGAIAQSRAWADSLRARRH